MIRNLSKNTILAEHEIMAVRCGTRVRGLIGHDFSKFDGMVFPACSAIHTFFMGMKIDVIFTDASGFVLGVYPEVPPWKFCLRERNSMITIELPAGKISETQTGKGDQLDFENI